MESIDVRGVPEYVAKAIAAMVEHLRRQQQSKPEKTPTQPVRLSVRPGKVLGSLRREDLYDDRI